MAELAPIELFKSKITSIHFNMNEMVELILNNTVPLNEVVQLAFTNQEPYSRYAAWITTHCLKKNSSLILPYSEAAIDALPNIIHDGQQREILRWFSTIDYCGKMEGILVDFCFKLLMNNMKPIGAKIHAMTILEKVINREPDLAQEFSIILEEIMPYMSVGGKNKTKKLLKKYKKESFEQ